MSNFSVVKYFPVENDNKVFGRGVVRVGDLVDVNFTLWKGKDGKEPWVGLPSHQDKSTDKWYKDVTIRWNGEEPDRELEAELARVVLAKAHEQTNSTKSEKTVSKGKQPLF